MQDASLLGEIALIAAVGVAVTVVLGRLRLPAVAGLLLSGALVGPRGFGLVGDAGALEMLAEVGVVLLLFMVGLELSLERMRHIFRRVALGGLLQVVGTTAVVAWVATLAGKSLELGIFLGFVVALSSTAIVLRALSTRGELDAPHGRFVVGTLVFQDLCVVPMVLLVPLLAGESGGASAGAGGSGAAAPGYGAVVLVALALAKAAAVVVGVLLLARLLVPRALGWVAASRSRELFLLAVVAVCVGTAWLTSLAGLSLALGAFLGGMVVADTEYSHRATGDMLPLRDVFVSLFFVSLGTFFDLTAVREHPLLVGLLLVGFVLGKGFLATLAALVMRFPARAAWLVGVSLAQFGEFGFVLVRQGVSVGLVEEREVAPLLSAGILSMFLTPLLVHGAPSIRAGERLLAPVARLLRARTVEEACAQGVVLEHHAIVVGYGVAGRLVAASLGAVGVPYVVLELNADAVRAARSRGETVYYGDATSAEVLGHAALDRARALVVLINDPHAAERVVDTVRRLVPHLPIFLRSRYLAERRVLERLGATEVVADEVEGGLEMLARVLRELDVPRNRIDAEVRAARAATQDTARASVLPGMTLGRSRELGALDIESVLIVEGARGAGRAVADLRLRTVTGATLVAIRRGGKLEASPSPTEPLQVGDVAYLVGDEAGLSRAVVLLGEDERLPEEPPGVA